MSEQPVWEEAYGQEDFTLVRVDYSPGLVQCGHAHDYASVTLVLAGEVVETVGSETVVGHPLSVVVKRPGVEHACRWGPNGARALSLEIDPGALEQLQLGGEDPASAWTRTALDRSCPGRDPGVEPESPQHPPLRSRRRTGKLSRQARAES